MNFKVRILAKASKAFNKHSVRLNGLTGVGAVETIGAQACIELIGLELKWLVARPLEGQSQAPGFSKLKIKNDIRMI